MEWVSRLKTVWNQKSRPCTGNTFILILRRWHNDIKPGNIIVVAGEYKLADPGFAKFKKKLETDPNSIPTIVAEGGTRTYGEFT